MEPSPAASLPRARRPLEPAPARHPGSGAWAPAPLPALLVLVGSLLVTGCGGPPGGGPGEEAGGAREEAGAAVRSYTVQGIVRQLPDPQDASKQLLIHHAPIPDYVNSEGYETGMPSMTMPFFPADGVELGEIAVGDWVELTLEVDWEATPAMQLTAIRPIEPPAPDQ